MKIANKQVQVYVGKLDGDDDGYVAVCKSDLSFCLYGKSEKEVKSSVEEALLFYLSAICKAPRGHKKHTVKVSNPQNLDLNEVYHFRPTKVFTAEAC